jgi:hypothetical protein
LRGRTDDKARHTAAFLWENALKRLQKENMFESCDEFNFPHQKKGCKKKICLNHVTNLLSLTKKKVAKRKYV